PRVLRLARLRQELADLLRVYSELYPDVQNLRLQIGALEREIAQAPAPAAGVPPDSKGVGTAPLAPAAVTPVGARPRQTRAEPAAELKAPKEGERRLRDTIAANEQRVANAPRREQELQELSRDYLTTRELHKTLTGRYEEAQLAENMEQR